MDWESHLRKFGACLRDQMRSRWELLRDWSAAHLPETIGIGFLLVLTIASPSRSQGLILLVTAGVAAWYAWETRRMAQATVQQAQNSEKQLDVLKAGVMPPQLTVLIPSQSEGNTSFTLTVIVRNDGTGPADNVILHAWLRLPRDSKEFAAHIREDCGKISRDQHESMPWPFSCSEADVKPIGTEDVVEVVYMLLWTDLIDRRCVRLHWRHYVGPPATEKHKPIVEWPSAGGYAALPSDDPLLATDQPDALYVAARRRLQEAATFPDAHRQVLDDRTQASTGEGLLQQ